MTNWKEDINEDGEVYLVLRDNWQVYMGDMEDLDKEEFEVIQLIIAAPKLLEACQKVLDDIQLTTSHIVFDSTIEMIDKALALAKNETLLDPPPDQIELDWSTW